MAGGVTDNLIINVNSNASNAANGLDRLRNALGRVSSGSGRTGSALKRIVSVLKQTGSAASSLSRVLGNSMVGNMKRAASSVESLLRSLKRVAMMRAMRALIREITQGFAEGIKNLYQWSQLAGTTFYRSMNTLATASQYLKNSLAAMASPLIEAVAPAIDYIVDKFVDMFNIVNQIIAKLTGRTSYTAAKKVAAQWGDASKKASGSAKSAADDIKRTILGFDEINKLNDQNKSSGSGGSGSGSGSTNYADMFETRQINSWISDIVETGNWSLLGSAVADRINKALGSIDWEVIKNKAKNVAKSFASLINGFIEEIDPVVIGKTLLGVITSAFTYIGTFWGSIEFAAAGLKLKQAIMTFFDGIDVEELAHNMTAKFRGIVTFIANAIPSSREEWQVISDKISGFITAVVKLEIPWATIGQTIGSLLLGSMTVITELAQNMTLTEIATGIKTVIENSLKSITREDIEKLVNAVLKDVLSAIKVILSIQIDLGDLTVSPVSIIMFAMLAKSMLGGVIGKVFGSGSMLSGMAFAVGITLAIEAIVELKDVINGIQKGEELKLHQVTGIMKKALYAAGFMLASRGYLGAGAVAVSMALIIEPAVKEITDVVNKVETNGINKGTVWDIIAAALKGTGLMVGLRGILGLGGFIGGKLNFGAMLSKGLIPAAAGIGLILAVTDIQKTLENLSGDSISSDEMLKIVGSALAGLGALSLLFNPAFGIFTITFGLVIRLIPEVKADLVSSNSKTAGAVLDTIGNLTTGGKFKDPETKANALELWGALAPSVYDYIKEQYGKYDPLGILDWLLPGSSSGSIADVDTSQLLTGNAVGSGKKWEKQVKKTGTEQTNQLQFRPVLKTNSLANGGDTSLEWIFDPKLRKKGIEVPVTYTKKDTSLVDNPQKNGIKTGVTFTSGGLFGGIFGGFNSTFLKWFGGGNKSTGQADLDTKVALKKNGWTTLSNFVGNAIDAGVRLYKGNYSSLQSFVGSWVEVELYLVPGDYATGAVMGSLIGVGYRAKGGVYSGGRWSDIPQYANGTPDAGTLFWAGEGGPEAIGHANGRTEVLNKSQLASAMYAAVTSAMKPASANFHDAAASMGNRNGNNDDLIEYVKDANAVLLRQNELLKQQNEYLRSINGKDFTAQITTQSINDAQRRSNRRAGVAVTTG